MLRWLLSKPKVIFGKCYIDAAREEGEAISVYIPVINLRRYGMLGYFFKRSEAIECRVKIEFIMNGKLFYRFVEHWSDSPIGKTILADSSYNDIPLVSESWERVISFPNSPLSTISPIPPYKIPSKALIIANIQVTSRAKVIAKSKWSIDIDQNRFGSNFVVRRVDKK